MCGRSVPLPQLVRTVAESGYRHIELAPRDELMPFSLRPRADRGKIAEFKTALKTHAVELSAELGPQTVPRATVRDQVGA